MPLIDADKVLETSRLLRLMSLERLDAFDARYYPPRSDPPEDVIMYFLVMVSMDHRLSRPNRPYQAYVGGELLRGADLLYRLGVEMYMKDRAFFTPQRLSSVTPAEILRWLSVGSARPPDPELRAHLLRDLGLKLLRLFDGRATKLLELSQGRLRGAEGYGLLDLLRTFKAYSDPVEKKSHLLVKFLVYRGLLEPVDRDNLNVAVDNHLTRVALRVGLVTLEEELLGEVLRGAEVSHDEDVVIRMAVREAYRRLSLASGLDPLLLDDVFWLFGRAVCTQDEPRCGACALRTICRSYKTGVYVPDLNYYSTWYY